MPAASGSCAPPSAGYAVSSRRKVRPKRRSSPSRTSPTSGNTSTRAPPAGGRSAGFGSVSRAEPEPDAFDASVEHVPGVERDPVRLDPAVLADRPAQPFTQERVQGLVPRRVEPAAVELFEVTDRRPPAERAVVTLRRAPQPAGRVAYRQRVRG